MLSVYRRMGIIAITILTADLAVFPLNYHFGALVFSNFDSTGLGFTLSVINSGGTL